MCVRKRSVPRNSFDPIIAIFIRDNFPSRSEREEIGVGIKYYIYIWHVWPFVSLLLAPYPPTLPRTNTHTHTLFINPISLTAFFRPTAHGKEHENCFLIMSSAAAVIYVTYATNHLPLLLLLLWSNKSRFQGQSRETRWTFLLSTPFDIALLLLFLDVTS
jgi:hypothetical protein